MLSNLSGRRLVIDGLSLAIAFSVIVLGSAYLNIWLWFDDFPPEIQALVEEPPEVPTWQPVIFGLALFGTILFIGVRSTAALLREGGDRAGFPLAVVHAFLLFQVVNAWDVVVLDWLIFTTWTPGFAVLPGTEGAAGYDNYWFHFWASYLNPVPWVGALVTSLLLASIATWRVRRERTNV